MASSDSTEYLTRSSYDSHAAALADVDRVLQAIAEVGEAQTVIAHTDLDFLIRRARELVAACAADVTRKLGGAS